MTLLQRKPFSSLCHISYMYIGDVERRQEHEIFGNHYPLFKLDIVSALRA